MSVPTGVAAASREQVARLGQVNRGVLERMRHEALTVPSEWVAEYGPYQSGGWWTTSLLNNTGKATDVAIADCEPVETDLLRRMPATREFLASMGLHFMWVRLARLAPNSFLWEHRDYGELDTVERQRVHVPLLTNSSAALVTGGAMIHLAAGYLWRLTPTYAHGACNMLGPDRLHLIIDCYPSEGLAALAGNERLDVTDVQRLPVATQAQLDEHLTIARNLADLGYEQTAETYLLRLFYQYTLPEGCVYDLIVSLHNSRGKAAKASAWLALRAEMLHTSGQHAITEGASL